MARGKKKESLTPEERLQAALVPESEQPYKVPENWCWCFLGNIVFIRRGASPRPIKTYVTEDEDGVNWIKIGDTSVGKYITHVNEKITEEGAKKSVFVEEGTLLLSNSMSFGHPYILKVKGCIHDGWLALTPSEVINKEYLYYALLTSEWYFEQVAVGTAVRNLNSGRVAETPTPLPPLSEQQRIVDRIESLFAKLDEAKQKAQEALDSFETRKAAILHKAFTGELTAQWRKEHGVGMESWSWIPLKKCGSWNGGGTPSMSHPEYWENGTLLWVTSKDMKSDLIEDTLMHTNMLGVENSSATYIEEPAVLFVMRSGILRRIFPVCMVKKPFTVNQDLKALVPTVDINLEYLFWACKANEKQILEKCMKSGTTVESINTAALRDFEIPIARKNEQTEIVRILDDLLAKEQQAKEAAEGVLEQIDLIKKAILARAFRGELGTNDPTEESAVELLKTIM